jgi:hypothetical protein
MNVIASALANWWRANPPESSMGDGANEPKARTSEVS